MKANVRNLLMITAAVTMTACSNHDVEEYVENNTKALYSNSFKMKYPNVSLNQSWDYSTKQQTFNLAGGTRSNVPTRGNGGGFTEDGWYEVDNNTLTWMHDQLVEERDNRSLGKPFYMSVPGNDFTIVPIFQGIAGAIWELHVVVDGNDYKVWTKSQDIEIKDNDNSDWHALHCGYHTWDDGNTWVYSEWEAQYNTIGGDKHTADGEPVVVNNVRAKKYVFSDFNVGDEMYFYLKVLEGAPDRCEVGAEQSSIKGMMLALQDVPRPANIPADNEVMIIGCEDSDGWASDWDMNDVVFLVYGKTVPKPVEITEGDEVERRTTVRYMIEDLGAMDDFDFNDIVIDVADIDIVSPIYTNGVLTGWNDKGHRQEAIIRHLGGTLPFRLTIGNTQLEEHEGVLGANPDEKYEVSGWDINRHNISVQVRQNNNSGVYNNVAFPKAGEAPMIIAVDPSQGWMTERQSVPESWFYVPQD